MAFHPSTLGRALLNLVQNAVDAMPQGERSRWRASARLPTSIQVRDTGHGIPPQQLTQIFEPLYTTKPGGPGWASTLCERLWPRMGDR